MKTAPRGRFHVELNNSGFLQGCVCTVLLDVAHTLSGDGHEDGLTELRYENAALLEVSLTANLAGRVELRSTRTVRVPSAYLS